MGGLDIIVELKWVRVYLSNRLAWSSGSRWLTPLSCQPADAGAARVQADLGRTSHDPMRVRYDKQKREGYVRIIVISHVLHYCRLKC